MIFEGVESISESVLLDLIRRDLERYAEDPRLPALDDAVFRIVYKYKLEGFDRVEVTSRVVADSIIFHVVENERIYLSRVEFLGATVFRVDELRQLVPGRFFGDMPPYSVRLAVLIGEGVLAAYRDRGYLEVAVEREAVTEPFDKTRMQVFYAIHEGKPYSVSELRGLPSDPELAKKTQEFLGKPFALSTGERLEATIIDHFRERGHPFCTARARPAVDRETGTVTIDLEVHTGPPLRISRTETKGAEWTRDSFIRSRADLEPDREYKASDLRRAEERLMATNIFKRVHVSPGEVEDDPGKVPIEIEVEERESGEASIRGGYGSFERLRVGVDLTGSNIWGGAETIRVGGTISFVGYRAEAELGIPYLVGTDFRLGLSGYLEARDYPSFDAHARGGVISLSYPVSEDITGTLGLRRANIVTLHVDPGVPPGDLLDFNYTAVFFTPTLDLRDNPLVPTRGLFFTSELSWSPNQALSDVQFWSLSGRVSVYIPLPWGLVLATSLQGGIIHPTGSTVEIPISLRYFAGGTNTVRGFRFESIGPQASGLPTGGEVFLSAQSEVRFPILGDLQGAVFADQGGVWFQQDEITFKDLRYGVGFGLRYVTPAGALVADLGWNPNRRAGEHTVEFHLSVGFPF